MALLDEGSTITIVDLSVAEAIASTGPVSSLCLQWTGNVSRYDEKSMNTKFESSGNNQHFHTIAARTIDKLNLNGQKKANITEGERLTLILIGQDNCHLITSREIIQPSPTARMMSHEPLLAGLCMAQFPWTNDVKTTIRLIYVRNGQLTTVFMNWCKSL
jgi:hypothetical protein